MTYYVRNLSFFVMTLWRHGVWRAAGDITGTSHAVDRVQQSLSPINATLYLPNKKKTACTSNNMMVNIINIHRMKDASETKEKCFFFNEASRRSKAISKPFMLHEATSATLLMRDKRRAIKEAAITTINVTRYQFVIFKQSPSNFSQIPSHVNNSESITFFVPRLNWSRFSPPAYAFCIEGEWKPLAFRRNIKSAASEHSETGSGPGLATRYVSRSLSSHAVARASARQGGNVGEKPYL